MDSPRQGRRITTQNRRYISMKANIYIVPAAVLAALMAAPVAQAKAENPPVVNGSCWVDKQGVIHGSCGIKKPKIQKPRGAK